MYPSLAQQQTSSKKSPPEQVKPAPEPVKAEPTSNTSKKDKSRKLSIKEKRKLRAERDLDLQAAAEAVSAASEKSLAQEIEPKKPATSKKNNSSGESEHSSVSPKDKAGENNSPPEAPGTASNVKNGVLMRTTSREFAVSRALGKYRQKKQQQARNSVGSNSDSQEDLDQPQQPLEPPEEDEELEEFNAKLAEFGQSCIDQNLVEETTTEDEPQQGPVLESSSSAEVINEAELRRQKEEELQMQKAAEAAKQAEEAARKAAQEATKVAKTAFGLFGASKFGKFARDAAAAAQQAAKESQQKMSQPPSRTPSRSSRRPSTEGESIDTDDEWYKHEIRQLEAEEYEKKIETIKPSASIASKMSHVLIELTATTPKVELETCQAHDREMKLKQNSLMAPPPRPPPASAEVLAESSGATSDYEDHKKVIKRFEDDYEEDEESCSAGAAAEAKQNRGRRGLEESSPDSDATQSGPDSLMEDTGGSSDNILLDSNPVVTSDATKSEKLPVVEADKKSPSQESRKSSSSNGSRRSRKSVKKMTNTETGAEEYYDEYDYASGQEIVPNFLVF